MRKFNSVISVFALLFVLTFLRASLSRAELASPSSSNPVLMKDKAIALAAGSEFTCAIVDTGKVKCWGDNDYGQLGNGADLEAPRPNSSVPVSVNGLFNAVSIAAGDQHVCIINAKGTVKCWGLQLANGTTANSSVPVIVDGITNAVSIAAGGYHTCAIESGGTVKCWGRNPHGVLGNGTTDESSTPITVSGITNATSISAGHWSTCAIYGDRGRVKCWGHNGYGQLGNDAYSDSAVPVAVSDITAASAISAGYFHTCAITVEAVKGAMTNGKVKCWGDNSRGQLGDGTTDSSRVPVTVSDVSRAASVATGNYFSCMLKGSGTAACWGNGGSGQLGDGMGSNSSTPVSVSDISGATSLSSGDHHTCAIDDDGTVKCWGDNDSGQLGDGTENTSDLPVDVIGF